MKTYRNIIEDMPRHIQGAVCVEVNNLPYHLATLNAFWEKRLPITREGYLRYLVDTFRIYTGR